MCSHLKWQIVCISPVIRPQGETRTSEVGAFIEATSLQYIIHVLSS
jgi:hypothetical protein